jgi:hypothetical protein
VRALKSLRVFGTNFESDLPEVFLQGVRVPKSLRLPGQDCGSTQYTSPKYEELLK